ncbi:MAG: response regulator [Pseudomonadota bacterium]
MESVERIMVVDDEVGICRNVEKILKKNNYEIVQARNAQEALEKMAKESFSLLISDIVMPGMNGLELLKLVKKEWPLTKAVMMTAYASTDTAVKAIRMGALDYIPKPFTPDELRKTVEKAFSGELTEARVTEKEKEIINVIDVDMPFDREEVAKYTGDDYVNTITQSGMHAATISPMESLDNYCGVGDMVCDIFKKLGATCKAGVKTSECPQKKAKKSKGASKAKAFDSQNLIGIDQPFNYNEVISVTGPEYVQYMDRDGFSFIPYEDLKKNVEAAAPLEIGKMIDVDMPFDREEVAKYTGDEYVRMVTPSDIPAVEIASMETLENYCSVGAMVCDIYKKLGATCKAGVKTSLCPQKKAKKSKSVSAPAAIVFDSKRLIAIDQPFDYEEVAAITGPEYIMNLAHEDLSVLPYEELRKIRVPELDKNAPMAADYPDLPKEPAFKNILVIDDEVAVNNNIRKILNKKGYHVDQAFTKPEALEKIADHSYKLVLLDLRIPGVKGLELLQTISEKHPETKVIMITGYASIETAVEAARIGAIEYLPKPFTPDEIRDATDRVLRLAA